MALSQSQANSMLEKAITDYDQDSQPGSQQDFQQLANGVFQAEGSITARLRGLRVTPIFTVGQALSPESLLFFVRLWFDLGQVGRLHLALSQNGRWIIRLTCESWSHVLGPLTQYFSFTYGEKYINFMKLATIYQLTALKDAVSQLEVAKLVYSLTTSSSSRVINLDSYCASQGLPYDGNPTPSHTYVDNLVVPTILFLMGVLLGDGSVRIRLRNVSERTGAIWVIPQLVLSQLGSTMNEHFLNMYTQGFKALGVNVVVSAPDRNGVLTLYVEGVQAVFGILLPYITQYNFFTYWKALRYNALVHVSRLLATGIQSTRQGMLHVLTVIYSYPNERTNPLEYWFAVADAYFNHVDAGQESGHAMITPWYNRKGELSAWKVCYTKKLKAAFPDIAKDKSFAFKKNGGADKALALALEHRNTSVQAMVNKL